MEICSYPYRPKLWAAVGGLISFSGAALLIGRDALSNNHDLVFRILPARIHLDPAEATVFLWCLTAFCVFLAFLCLKGLYLRFFTTRCVTLTDTEISAPQSMYSRTSIVVKLSDVRSLSVSTIRWFSFLTIQHANGKLVIPSSQLPNRNAFNTLVGSINRRLPTQQHLTYPADRR